jgi:hypothetical protein
MNGRFWIVSVMSLSLCCPVLWAQGLNARRFDGRWWQAAAAQEKEGYIEGGNDCYPFELLRIS